MTAPEQASAAQYTYCYNQSSGFNWCPWQPGGNRHTFIDNVGMWGTVPHAGCEVIIGISGWVAYTDTIAGWYKYYREGCNTVYHSYPGNTELLRLYIYDGNGGGHFLYGNGAY